MATKASTSATTAPPTSGIKANGNDAKAIVDDDEESTAHPHHTPLENNQCRMYEKVYPDNDDLVVVLVKNIAEMGAYVSLLEYNNIEGMILLSELSRRRIRSINKLIRVGRQEVVVVLRVDKEKGYIDLSKRRVSPEEVLKAEDRFNKSKAVHSIIRHVSELCRVRMIELYQSFGWDLYKKYGHAYDAFKLCVTEGDKVLAPYKLRDDVKQALIKQIQRRMTPQAVKIRADIEVNCFSYDGIDAIKAGLQAGEKDSEEGVDVKIKLVAPPLYVIMTSCLDRERGIEVLNRAINTITKVVTSRGGNVNVKAQARAVSERDDHLLDKMMEVATRQQAQIAGDDDTEEGVNEPTTRASDRDAQIDNENESDEGDAKE